MCEIFPEVNNCCYFYTLRVGMLFIGVLSVITGAMILAILEQSEDADYDHLKDVGKIRTLEHVLAKMGLLIPSGISAMSVIFIVAGFFLLVATLSDQEGLVQVFVWGVFFNVILGFFMVIAIAFQCLMYDTCTLSRMDWLSGSAFLVMIVGYLFVWIYFVIVANSTVVGL